MSLILVKQLALKVRVQLSLILVKLLSLKVRVRDESDPRQTAFPATSYFSDNVSHSYKEITGFICIHLST